MREWNKKYWRVICIAVLSGMFCVTTAFAASDLKKFNVTFDSTKQETLKQTKSRDSNTAIVDVDGFGGVASATFSVYGYGCSSNSKLVTSPQTIYLTYSGYELPVPGDAISLRITGGSSCIGVAGSWAS